MAFTALRRATPLAIACVIACLTIAAATARPAVDGTPSTRAVESSAMALPEPNQTQSRAARATAALLSESRFHYKPRRLDDALSNDIFHAYLKALDPERLFFVADDIKAFEMYRTTLDDGLKRGDLAAPYRMFAVFVKRVEERMNFARAELKAEPEFTSDVSFDTDRENAPWPTDRAAAESLWSKRVQNDWLRLKLAGSKSTKIVSTLDRRYRGLAERTGELDSEDVFQAFMNSYASSIDPHSAYMNPRTSENFNMAMRLSLEGIGAVLQRREDYIAVRSIVRGGPADLHGGLAVGDRIVGVGQGERGPVTEVVGWRIDDVVDLIRGAKGTAVRLELLPAITGIDGPPKTITIVRQQVKLEEQAASSQIMTFERDGKTRRIGLIELPTFYLDFEGRRLNKPDHRSATRDVARLLAALKKENVEGIVLDLRDNGGGSLLEAIELTGLFVDQGPVVQVRDAAGRREVHGDDDAGVAWGGPLAILINRTSASASEIFAAAIQDYGRGLIIGEPSFGKGTVQNLVDLDGFLPGEKAGLGQVKFTVQQFFRINGGSTQHRGVVPDILFPVTIDADEFGESALDHALPYSEIERADYDQFEQIKPLIPQLAARHAARVADDREFNWWVEDIADYRKRRADTMVSLNEAQRRAERDEIEARRLAREEQRREFGLVVDSARRLEADDGLQADEREIEADDRDGGDPPDVLAREAGQILADATDLLGQDKGLATRVFPHGVPMAPKPAMPPGR